MSRLGTTDIDDIGVILDSQTGEVSGNPKLLAALLKNGVMREEEVLPRLEPGLRAEVQRELGRAPGLVSPRPSAGLVHVDIDRI